jgi:bifunctional UDP-N-acetylglucosamine pyrophosphorylase / glucosamine-1-phosphate N-acetyltransferase
MPNPASVEIGDDVLTDRISGEGVVLHGGTRITGAKTFIGPGVKLSHEAPVTLNNCQLGSQVELKGGFFSASAFLDKANMASGAHVREGCLLEEESNGAHSVGLKQTILFPFVTLGSLINFCDCFMSGGNSRKNHSEVGSSYIHFNYTPNQDKATASLIGDVPRGVMLNQAPIFLGGQGGLVGPVRLGYGTVTLAGTILRGDYPEGGKLIGQSSPMAYEITFHQGFYADIKRRVQNNILYLANIIALRQWYDHARRLFMTRNDDGRMLHEGAMEKLDIVIDERLKRLENLSEKMDLSIRIAEKITRGQQQETLIHQSREFQESWPLIKETLTGGYEQEMDAVRRDQFLRALQSRMSEEKDYIHAIRGLDYENAVLGTTWLQNIVDELTNRALDHLPSCKSG